MRRRCEEEAQEIVRHANSSTGQPCVENENLTDLISRLTAILLQIKVHFRENIFIFTPKRTMLICCEKFMIHRLYQVFFCLYLNYNLIVLKYFFLQCLAEGGDLNSFEFKSLTDSLNDIKSTIDASNIR